ncbi:MAG TPA: 2-C-methyl-D-erythritol 4-phosphate cytidylyltransferase [Lachnospiraceae bacterium]|nr:2-C-methyl-D-erythritol 4-phosphate cytidylyltransferase [Lachnospiraceae bacterium]
MNAAIVLAAGRGKRMGMATPKQFLMLDGEILLAKTLRAFEESPEISEIILVTGEEWVTYCREEVVAKNAFRKVHKIIVGGARRHESVYAGLLACPEADYVLIHDGARPFVTEDIIKRTVEAVYEYKACAVGVPSKDTVKIVDKDGFISSTPLRKNVWNIQTPQAFEYPLIRAAYEIAKDSEMEHITDDAMVVEGTRLSRVKVIMGAYENIKITTPDDLKGRL